MVLPDNTFYRLNRNRGVLRLIPIDKWGDVCSGVRVPILNQKDGLGLKCQGYRRFVTDVESVGLAYCSGCKRFLSINQFRRSSLIGGDIMGNCVPCVKKHIAKKKAQGQKDRKRRQTYAKQFRIERGLYKSRKRAWRKQHEENLNEKARMLPQKLEEKRILANKYGRERAQEKRKEKTFFASLALISKVTNKTNPKEKSI